jgi:hypothetical protein
MTAPERFADSQIPLAPRAPSIHDPSLPSAVNFAVMHNAALIQHVVGAASARGGTNEAARVHLAIRRRCGNMAARRLSRLHHGLRSDMHCRQPIAIACSPARRSGSELGAARERSPCRFLRSRATSMTETLIASQARARFVVTLPQQPSLVGCELLRLSRASFTTLTDTSDAFLHLARRARERLVIMTPFIDTTGAAWAADIFEASTAARKILVMRNSADLDACGREGLRVRAAAQRICDYTFRHERSDGPADIETFHAKIVLADGVAAYVGSANFLYRSRGPISNAVSYLRVTLVRRSPCSLKQS